MKNKRPPIPIPTHPIIETHFHLDMLKVSSKEETIALARKHNIEKLITIATGKDNLDPVIEFAAEFPEIYCSQGCHPHDSIHWDLKAQEKLHSNLLDPKKNIKIVAIGEIGLDYYYSKSPHIDQMRVFEELLDTAQKFNLPAIIHTRDADKDTQLILSRHQLSKKGVIHSFTSSPQLAEFVLAEGYFIGFNGIVTFKNAANVREVLQLTPLDRILIETDAPFLTPEPYRGVENNPCYLPFIAAKIAEVKNVSLEEVLKQVYQNALSLFPL